MASLTDICLDNIILSNDPAIQRDIWNLPTPLLELLDERYLKMENTKKYKRHFRKYKKLSKLK